MAETSSDAGMKPFPDVFGISDYELPPPRTLNELFMIKLSSAIRSKPNWWTKYKDPEIRARWREEALGARMVWVERATMLVPFEGADKYFGEDGVYAGGNFTSPYGLEESVVRLGEREVEYVLDELDGYAGLRDEESGVEVSCFDGIWHSDKLIDDELRERLRKGVSILEDVPDSEKDWHPGSDGMVLDLVHPSLYPVVYNRTHAYQSRESRVSEEGNEHKENAENSTTTTTTTKKKTEPEPEPLEPFRPLPIPKYIQTTLTHSHSHSSHSDLISQKFQWLPTDFLVSQNEDGRKTVNALGYINNLLPCPAHVELYGVIEDVLGRFVPVFERVLMDMVRTLPVRIPGEYGGPVPRRRRRRKTKTESGPEPESKPQPESGEDAEGAEDAEGEDDDDEEEEEEDEDDDDNYEYSVDDVVLPELPDGGYKGGLEQRENVVSLRGRTIQVIVKLANIHLTPEQPEYEGGSWHIEGMANERIVASGIYYYDQENITGSELAFRIAVDEPERAKHIQAAPYDYVAHYKTWGMVMSYNTPTKLNNVVGATPTLPNRCLAFPNIYQHRVSPFRLEDASRPGHRKILAFFLVDPNLESSSSSSSSSAASGPDTGTDPDNKYGRIPSTSTVPPQQRKWLAHIIHSQKHQHQTQTQTQPQHQNQNQTQSPTSRSLWSKLPDELITAILDSLGEVIMSEDEARKYREELMDERSAVANGDGEWDDENTLFTRDFNLCEH